MQSGRGVNLILISILRFWLTSWRYVLYIVFSLKTSFSGHRDTLCQKNCPKRTFWSDLFIFGRKFVCLFCCNTLSDFDLLFLNCSSQRAEKDAGMYLNSTMDCFWTVGISRFQFWLILQIICEWVLDMIILGGLQPPSWTWQLWKCENSNLSGIYRTPVNQRVLNFVRNPKLVHVPNFKT